MPRIDQDFYYFFWSRKLMGSKGKFGALKNGNKKGKTIEAKKYRN